MGFGGGGSGVAVAVANPAAQPMRNARLVVEAPYRTVLPCTVSPLGSGGFVVEGAVSVLPAVAHIEFLNIDAGTQQPAPQGLEQHARPQFGGAGAAGEGSVLRIAMWGGLLVLVVVISLLIAKRMFGNRRREVQLPFH